MSEQGPSTAGAAIGKNPKEPKSSSGKKSRSKHGKPKINRNAKKNAKIGKITTQDAKPAANLTAIDNPKASGISKLPRGFKANRKQSEQVIDPIPAENPEQTENLTPTGDQNIPNDHETSDNCILKGVIPAEEATSTMIPVGEDIPDAIAVNKPTDKTNTEADNNESMGAMLGDDATAVNVSKVKKRKRRNRKTPKENKPAIVAENPKPADAPPAPDHKEPSAMETKVVLYSEVVKPTQDRSTEEPVAGASEPRPHSPTAPWDISSCYDEDDTYESASYDSENDYGGIQDSFYELRL